MESNVHVFILSSFYYITKFCNFIYISLKEPLLATTSLFPEYEFSCYVNEIPSPSHISLAGNMEVFCLFVFFISTLPSLLKVFQQFSCFLGRQSKQVQIIILSFPNSFTSSFCKTMPTTREFRTILSKRY